MREGSLPPRRRGRPPGSNRLVTAINAAETRHALAGLLKRRKRRKPAKPASMLAAVLALTEAKRPIEPALKKRKRRKRRKPPVRRIDQFRRILSLLE